jgi:hypothetical protein
MEKQNVVKADVTPPTSRETAKDVDSVIKEAAFKRDDKKQEEHRDESAARTG